MLTTNSLTIALGLALVAAPACEGMQDDARMQDDEAQIEFRDGWPTGTGLNTPIAGGLVISNWKAAPDVGSWGLMADNDDGTFQLNSAKVFHNGKKRTVTALYTDPHGVLTVEYGPTGGPFTIVTKEEVQGLTIETTSTPSAAALNPVDALLKITQVECWELQAEAGSWTCRYLMGVDIDPGDPLSYPQLPYNNGQFHALCKTDSDGGSLDTKIEKNGVMFADKVHLDTTGTPTLSGDAGGIAVACYASALGKGMWQHEITWDWTSSLSRKALSLDHAMSIFLAIQAWIDGGSSTLPGANYCLSDVLGGLFGADCDTAYGADSHVEAGYGPAGAFCTNQVVTDETGRGTHRIQEDPNDTIAPWGDFPGCSSELEASTLAAGQNLGGHVVAWTMD